MDTNTRRLRRDQQKKSVNGKAKVYNIIKSDSDYNSPPKGEKISTCKKCGKKFQQIFYPEQNRYSSFDICPSCRRKISEERKNAGKEVEESIATLPFKPFPWQKKSLEDFEKTRFQVIDAGNRTGKGPGRS